MPQLVEHRQRDGLYLSASHHVIL